MCRMVPDHLCPLFVLIPLPPPLLCTVDALFKGPGPGLAGGGHSFLPAGVLSGRRGVLYFRESLRCAAPFFSTNVFGLLPLAFGGTNNFDSLVFFSMARGTAAATARFCVFFFLGPLSWLPPVPSPRVDGFRLCLLTGFESVGIPVSFTVSPPLSTPRFSLHP